MTLWLDAQLPPSIAAWVQSTFAIECHCLEELGLRDADDLSIFQAAHDAGAVVMTKDTDFVDLIGRFGPPPQVLWLTCGNTSNARLRAILTVALPTALPLLEEGENLVEIGDAPPTVNRTGIHVV